MRTLFVLFLIAALLMTPTPAAAQTSDCFHDTYMIQPGDTLGLIAVRCNIPYTVILGINWQIKDPNTVYPGQVIRLEAETLLPTEQQPVTEGGPLLGGLQPDGSYIVRRGDSLARISFLFHVTLRDLLDHNPQVREDGIILPGDRLTLPPAAAEFSGGFVGIPDTDVFRGQKFVVEIHHFPPFTPIDVFLKNIDYDPAKVYDAETDALGNAYVTVTIPTVARMDETWVVYVETTELEEVFRATSAGMVIQ